MIFDSFSEDREMFGYLEEFSLKDFSICLKLTLKLKLNCHILAAELESVEISSREERASGNKKGW